MFPPNFLNYHHRPAHRLRQALNDLVSASNQEGPNVNISKTKTRPTTLMQNPEPQDACLQLLASDDFQELLEDYGLELNHKNYVKDYIYNRNNVQPEMIHTESERKNNNKKGQFNTNYNQLKTRSIKTFHQNLIEPHNDYQFSNNIQQRPFRFNNKNIKKFLKYSKMRKNLAKFSTKNLSGFLPNNKNLSNPRQVNKFVHNNIKNQKNNKKMYVNEPLNTSSSDSIPLNSPQAKSEPVEVSNLIKNIPSLSSKGRFWSFAMGESLKRIGKPIKNLLPFLFSDIQFKEYPDSIFKNHIIPLQHMWTNLIHTYLFK